MGWGVRKRHLTLTQGGGGGPGQLNEIVKLPLGNNSMTERKWDDDRGLVKLDPPPPYGWAQNSEERDLTLPSLASGESIILKTFLSRESRPFQTWKKKN